MFRSPPLEVDRDVGVVTLDGVPINSTPQTRWFTEVTDS